MKNEYPNFEFICGLLGQQGTKTHKKPKKQTKKDGKRASPLVLREKGMPSCLSQGYGHPSLSHVLGH